MNRVHRRGNPRDCQVHEELFKFPSCQRTQMETRNPFRFTRLVSVRKLEYQVLRENQNPHGACDNSYTCEVKGAFMTVMRRGPETEPSGPRRRMWWIIKALDVQRGTPHATGGSNKGETCRHHECGVHKRKNVNSRRSFIHGTCRSQTFTWQPGHVCREPSGMHGG